jgi:hypothetical protein
MEKPLQHHSSNTQHTLLTILGEELHQLVTKHFVIKQKQSPEIVHQRLLECLKYLYLVSLYPQLMKEQFFPLTQEVDEIWHYLIIQTREYIDLCQRLPGTMFIHHKSLPFGDHIQTRLNRKGVIEELLLWIPLYHRHFGPFESETAEHWKIISFLHHKLKLTWKELENLACSQQDSISLSILS